MLKAARVRKYQPCRSGQQRQRSHCQHPVPPRQQQRQRIARHHRRDCLYRRHRHPHLGPLCSSRPVDGVQNCLQRPLRGQCERHSHPVRNIGERHRQHRGRHQQAGQRNHRHVSPKRVSVDPVEVPDRRQQDRGLHQCREHRQLRNRQRGIDQRQYKPAPQPLSNQTPQACGDRANIQPELRLLRLSTSGRASGRRCRRELHEPAWSSAAAVARRARQS